MWDWTIHAPVLWFLGSVAALAVLAVVIIEYCDLRDRHHKTSRAVGVHGSRPAGESGVPFSSAPPSAGHLKERSGL